MGHWCTSGNTSSLLHPLRISAADPAQHTASLIRGFYHLCVIQLRLCGLFHALNEHIWATLSRISSDISTVERPGLQGAMVTTYRRGTTGWGGSTVFCLIPLEYLDRICWWTINDLIWVQMVHRGGKKSLWNTMQQLTLESKDLENVSKLLDNWLHVCLIHLFMQIHKQTCIRSLQVKRPSHG